MNFRVFDSVNELAAGIADTLVQQVESGVTRVISLSGGNTPKVIYPLLGSGERRQRLANHEVIWVMGDERCVPPDDPQSNSKMVRETIFKEGISDRHTFLRFETELEDPATIAAAFEAKWKALGIQQLDVALLGMGDDGHTASLFPGTDVLTIRDRIAKEVWVEKMNSWRVTLTFPVLQAAKQKFVMTTGEGKKAMLTRVAQGEYFPVAEATKGAGQAWWFVDKAAYPG